MAERVTPFGASENGAGRAEENRRRSPVSIPAASPKAALHAFTAEGGGSFAAPAGHALSFVKTAFGIEGKRLTYKQLIATNDGLGRRGNMPKMQKD